MLSRKLRPLCAGVLLCFGTGVQAAVIDVTTLEDGSLAEQCSLRDAFKAVSTHAAVNGCAAGTGQDTIRVVAGQTYTLSEGALVLGGQTGQRPELDEDGEQKLDEHGEPVFIEYDVSPRLKLEVTTPASTDPDYRQPATLVAAAADRVLQIKLDAEIELKGLVLKGGDARALTPPHGGLIYAEGSVRGTTLELLDGQAEQGGALFLEKNAGLRLSDALLVGNHADAAGGAVAVGDDYRGTVQLEKVFASDNHSGTDGGVLHLAGDNVTLVIGNATFWNNQATTGGAVIHFGEVENQQRMAMLNVTLAQNQGPALHMDGSGDNDLIANSFIGGNGQADCSGAGIADLTAVFSVVGPSCPQSSDLYTAAVNRPGGQNLSAAATMLALSNSDGACPDDGSLCQPIRSDDGEWRPGFLPNDTLDPLTANQPTLLDAGSDESDIRYSCNGDDQRGKPRADRCDAGAFQFQRASGMPDNIRVVMGESTVLDVVANDLGDTRIDCANLSPCIWVERQSGRAVTIVGEVDDDGYPTLRYTPHERFHGRDDFEYLIDRRAFIGRTFSDRDVGARVNITSEPATGMTRSKSVGSLGALWLLAAPLALLRRRRLAALVATLMAVGTAGAAEITVNSTDDEVDWTPQAGVCTLRQAIYAALDKFPNSTGCASGQTGSDTIKLPEGTITLAGVPLLVEPANALVIEGVSPEKTIIDAGQLSRIMENRSSVTLRNLTLRNGNAGNGNGGAVLALAGLTMENVVLEHHRAQRGGAIYLGGQSVTLTLANIHAHHNQAQLDGGVLSSMAQTLEHRIAITAATFSDNRAANGSGGALDLNVPYGRGNGRLTVSNSVFLRNQSATGGSAIDFEHLAVSTNLTHLTVLDNTGGSGAFELGNVALSDQDGSELSVSIRIGNSIYANPSDSCGTGNRQFKASGHNLFVGHHASCEQWVDPAASSTPPANTNTFGGNLAAIRAALNGGVLTTSQDVQKFQVPFLPITDLAFTDILDVGNNDDEVTADSSQPLRCLRVDQRGAPRPAGDGCDRGAYELQVTTTPDMEGSNARRVTRTVYLDVLPPAIPGDDYRWRTGSLTLEKVAGDAELEDTLGTAYVRQRRLSDDDQFFQGYDEVILSDEHGVVHEFSVADIDLPDRICGEGLNTDGSANKPAGSDALDDDCIVVYRLDPEIYRPSQVQCDALPFTDHFRYSLTAQKFTLGPVIPDAEDEEREVIWEPGATITRSGLVTVTVDNRAPLLPRESISRHIQPGGRVTIDLRAAGVQDTDGVLTELKLTKEPMTAARDENRKVLGTGIILDPDAMTVTYVHGDVSKNFTDRFELRVVDDCGDGVMVPITITFPRDHGAGGELHKKVGSGSLAVLGLLLLAAIRRR
ncbi:choice-of-anchor Q domain-containing protein [Isoalcanivorax beigongshangi]|uniref:Choice-of-anchor Q domain-containing protein n=1 Tax=Isoalcanivorax beigongshangi TaxID=3238810 RepID=A0ABV4AGD2_9GAMM